MMAGAPIFIQTEMDQRLMNVDWAVMEQLNEEIERELRKNGGRA